MQPASQRPRMLPVPLIVTLLIAQALAAASQPTHHHCKTVGLHAGSFRKMSFF